jgi:outer membrane protein assembly factor BamB
MSRRIEFLLLLSLASSCADREAPRVASWAAEAFGENVGWSLDDPQGAGFMPPSLGATQVYFERLVASTGSVQTGPDQLVAVDREAGRFVWGANIISAFNADTAAGFVGAPWGSLEIFNHSTGARMSSFHAPGSGTNSNVVSDGSHFFVLGFNGHAFSVDAATGASVWETNLSNATSLDGFAVTLAGSRVIAVLKYFRSTGVTEDSGIVVALDRATGAVQWRVSLGTLVQNSGAHEAAVVSGSTVVARTERHAVIALDLATGSVRWQFDAAYGHPTNGSDGLAACDGRVIVASGDFGLVALDAVSGQVIWKIGDIDQASLRGIKCSYGTVLAGALAVFDAATGTRLGTYPHYYPYGSRDLYITGAVRDKDWIYAATSYGYAKFRAP